MKSPTRDHYQSQTVYKIGFASYFHLRFLLSTFILLGLVLYPTSGVLARKATIVGKGSGTATNQSGTAYYKFEEKIQLQLPEEDGPVRGEGRWRSYWLGSGLKSPDAAGRVVLKGELRNGFLVYPEPDYYDKGNLEPKTGPPYEVPEGLIWRFKTEHGSEVVKHFNANTGAGVARIRTVYRLEMSSSERWQITVDGWTRKFSGSDPGSGWHRPKELGKRSPWKVDPGDLADKKYSDVAYGLKVHWRMVVNVEIENDRYKFGEGNASMVSATSISDPAGVFKCRATRSTVSNVPFGIPNGVKSGQQLTLDMFKQGQPNEVVLRVYTQCEQDKLAAETVIIRERVKELKKRDRFMDACFFPGRISVPLIDGWSSSRKGTGAEDWERISYKVKKIK